MMKTETNSLRRLPEEFESDVLIWTAAAHSWTVPPKLSVPGT